MSDANANADVAVERVSIGTAARNATQGSTLEGMCLAYGSLFALAVLPIWIGSFRSVRFLQISRKNGDQEVLSNRDAMILPLFASYQLWTLNTLRNHLAGVADDNDHLLYWLSKALLAIFCGLGVVEITRTAALLLSRFWPRNAARYSLTVVHYKAQTAEGANSAGSADAQRSTADVDGDVNEKLTVELIRHQRQADEDEDKDEDEETDHDHDQSTQPVQIQIPIEKQRSGKVYFAVNFTYYDITVLAASCVVCAWYLVQKHWVASNIIGLSLAVRAIESLQINTVKTGAILLGGLLAYDVFWVFGTDVMLSAAMWLNAPLKLVFPLNLLENGLFVAGNFCMIGLGDIIIPGAFVALLLRFDVSLHEHEQPEKESLSKRTNTVSCASARRTYFLTGYMAYIGGLVTTIAVMHWFNHGQPALLYLVPSCLGVPLVVALVRGDLGRLLRYADAPVQPAAADSSSASHKKSA